MKSKLSKFILLGLILFLNIKVSAQSNMEESFHANGSIRVVVAVAAIVMAGLLYFILRLERRLKKLEQQRRPEK